MLSRSPASRVSRPCSQGLLRTLTNNSSSGSQQLRRGASSFLAQRRNFVNKPNLFSPNSTVRSLRKSDVSLNTGRVNNGTRLSSTDAASADAGTNVDRKDAIYALIDEINNNEMEMVELMEDLDLLDDHHAAIYSGDLELDDVFSQTIGHRDQQTLEGRVRAARQQFGETLPEGYLNDTETELYIQLYGEPITREQELALEADEDEKDPNVLLREDGEGGWEEIEVEQFESEEEPPVVYDMEAPPPEDMTATMIRAREIAEQLGGEIMLEESEGDAEQDDTPRLHPRTTEGKYSTDPSTVFLPKDTVAGPISVILSDFSNKHIKEMSHRVFGGPRLSHSTSTPPASVQIPQLPIPLEATQRNMTEMEANSFLAVLYPGMYASSLSVLSEVRKRLGSDWLRGLITKEGGPSVLDASAGGAGALAWRDIIRAEWDVMSPGHPKKAPYPLGKSTVVTAADSLRLRASVMLENTSFLPRLPDYVHTRDKPTLDDERAPAKHKQYDVIIAPHSLLGIGEEFMRKEHVENLWSLLNPDGGVLILLEKGHQRGFEAIAGARDMLLKRHIKSPGSTHYENLTESPDDEPSVEKETGMIVAPCTNHGKCPMMHTAGRAPGRKDFCHFQQRYIRPQFLQRIMGAKDRNHEDLKFSYLAVQRGVDLRQEDGITQNQEATDAAFAGYEHLDDTVREQQTPEEAPAKEDGATAAPTTQEFRPLALPRIVYPPMKRRGHVIFDVCTSAGKIERWTVPRSYSRRAYKDARKSQWGDLWALGAKTRIHRNLRIGDKHGEGRKERLERRAAAKAQMEGSEDVEEQTGKSSDFSDLPIPEVKRNVPSWKKNADKKTLRQAAKRKSDTMRNQG